MPYRVTFALNLFNGPQQRSLSRRALAHMLHCMYEIDLDFLKDNLASFREGDPRRVPEIYRSGVTYMEEPPGQEDWQDIPTTLDMGIGDCLPTSTRVLREDGKATRIVDLEVGDRIMGDGTMTRVLAVMLTGVKPILTFDLGTGDKLRCSPDHRLFRQSGTEIRAKDVTAGDQLRQPERTYVAGQLVGGGVSPAIVTRVTEDEPTLCADITTDTGRFYLPDAGVVVHNCEDLASWRAAELTARYGIQARPVFVEQPRPNGSMLYHIVVRFPDGRTEDPSRILGMR